MKSKIYGLLAVLVFSFPTVLSAQSTSKTVPNSDPFRPPAITTENVPVVPQAIIERLRQYQNMRSAGFAGWSPDGKGILVQTRFGNTSQLHRVYEPGGRRDQVTFFDEPASGRFIPNETYGNLLVTMSAGGNENYQVFHLNRITGQATQLTDGQSRNQLGPVLYDGSRMIVSNNARNGRDTDLYIAHVNRHGSLKMILRTNGEYWRPVDWSRDKFTLAINRYVSINETYPALLDIVTGRKTELPLLALKTSYGAMAFTPEGKSLYVACDANGEFRQLARVDLDTFEYSWLTEEIFWDVSEIEIEPNSGLVAFTTNEDGAGALYFLGNVHSEKPQTIFGRGGGYVLELDRPFRADLPLGIISSLEFSPDGRQLGFTLSQPDAPADAYSLNLSDGKLTRWTYGEVGGLDTIRFISPMRIQFPTFDMLTNSEGKKEPRMIPAYYFKPHGASKERPVPVLINIHGGPESQYRPYFSGTDQFYLNEMGFAVIRPNVRGSRGYGKSYLQLDNGELRENSVKDIGKLLDWVKQQPELDESRIAVYGGSYGGYMVLGSLTNFPDRIRAGVDLVGIASFTTFLKNTSPYRRDLRRAEYGDERDPKMQAVFARINPTSSAHKIKSELLVAHGRNDPRVPFTEAVQIVEKVRKSGKQVWTVYADNEGHGFRKKANRDYLDAVIAMFLAESLE